MHIYTDKRTGIKYISYSDPTGRRVRRSLGTTNKGVATLKAAEILDIKAARNSGKIALDLFLLRYRDYLKATRKPKTAYHFELGLKKLLAFKRVQFLEDITPALLDNMAVTLKSKIKGDTAAGLNRAIRALKTAMHQAEFWELIPPQNWRKVSEFKESRGRVEFHTPQEIKQILALFNPAWRLVVLLGCRAGLRRGEIAALKWADVDFANNQLYIAPNKTENHRYVPISADLNKALKQVHATHGKKEYVVNVGQETSRQSKDFLTAYYLKMTADLPFDCKLHKLRHTFASHLVQAGVDLYRVSKLLGHSTIQMTEIYAHLAPADLTSAVQKLPAIK